MCRKTTALAIGLLLASCSGRVPQEKVGQAEAKSSPPQQAAQSSLAPSLVKEILRFVVKEGIEAGAISELKKFPNLWQSQSWPIIFDLNSLNSAPLKTENLERNLSHGALITQRSTDPVKLVLPFPVDKQGAFLLSVNLGTSESDRGLADLSIYVTNVDTARDYRIAQDIKPYVAKEDAEYENSGHYYKDFKFEVKMDKGRHVLVILARSGTANIRRVKLERL